MNKDEYDLDLGCDHYLAFSCWKPDRELNPQYDGIPDIERLGALIPHLTKDGKECNGFVYFDLPEVRDWLKRSNISRELWKVESMEPLTLSPSILCKLCGDHGFIRNGRWVKA